MTFVEKYVNGKDGVRGLIGANEVLVTPGGGYVIAAGFSGDSVSVFRRDATDGRLKFVQLLREGTGGANGQDGAAALALSPDATKLYVGSLGDFNTPTDGGIIEFPIGLFLLANPSSAENALVKHVREPTSRSHQSEFCTRWHRDQCECRRWNFTDLDALRDHVQLAIDLAVVAAGKGEFGGIIASIDVDGVIHFRAQPSGLDIKTALERIEELTVDTAGGDDRITLAKAPPATVKKVTINTDGGNDTVSLMDLSPQIPGSPNTPTTIVNLGAGRDIAQLRSNTPNTSLEVNGGSGLMKSSS